MNPGEEACKKLLEECIVDPSEKAQAWTRLENFHQLLHEKNTELGLVSDKDLPLLWTRHFADSLMILKHFPGSLNSPLLDIGSGAGFPGLILAVCYPDKEYSLLDSNGKRTQFLSDVIQRLKLENCRVIKERAEVVGQDPNHRGKYSMVVTRATAKEASIAELTLPLVSIGGYAYYWAGSEDWQNLKKIGTIVEHFGGWYDSTVTYRLPQDPTNRERKIVAVKKVKQTLDKFPRRIGVPQKKPIDKEIKS